MCSGKATDSEDYSPKEYVAVKQFSVKTIVPKTMCSGKATVSEDYSPKDYVYR